MGQEFVGAGWAFPLRTGPSGDVALVTREREIEESVRLILGTAYMERPMRPEFGCGIHDYVFSAADETARGRIAHEVRISLERWEPRIDVMHVQATLGGVDGELVQIEVLYSVKGTNDPRNLVFPFYVIPAEDDQRALTEGTAP
ncbi:MAG TPA: GPW/gp25 family protein [Actinomycetota bacterium]|nr:GPW/gp25 family protein [Actinomycetota bacterium]